MEKKKRKESKIKGRCTALLQRGKRLDSTLLGGREHVTALACEPVDLLFELIRLLLLHKGEMCEALDLCGILLAPLRRTAELLLGRRELLLQRTLVPAHVGTGLEQLRVVARGLGELCPGSLESQLPLPDLERV